ncbi:MAG: hypothetical protein US76_03740 [Parcubacteria group bacterium GW2011_GWA2_38_13b]|nr:MAG: hypothetical protein US76_03740 [Parcubacteria group bacterium GW2011_GWA2_38_13b]
MNLTKQTKFIIAIGIQLIILFAIIIFKSSVLIGGTEVLLKIEPVDPRDILRGDYVELRYSNLSTIDLNLFKASPKDNDKAYTSLIKNGKYWEAVLVGQQKPKTGLFIQGVVSDIDSNSADMIYGIEEYFIPENTGINFDFNKGEPYVEVAINKNGSAVLKQLYVYDTPFEEYAKKYPPVSLQQKSRDARRISDTIQLQPALESYYDAHGYYPASLNLLAPEFIGSLPKDPIFGNDYIYAYYPANNPSRYHLGVILETRYEFLNEDSDCDSSIKDGCALSTDGPFANGFNGDDNGVCGVEGAQGFCYDIVP